MIADPTTAYARAVVAGEIIAGPLVREACRRHFRDLETGPERGLRFDLEAADRVMGFFQTCLTVEVETVDSEGQVSSEPAPFVLQPSQQFILGSLFGWKNDLGYRRFRRAYVEIGKGNGKSPLAAGIGHYMFVADGKLRSEVYSAATDKSQASVLFNDAVAMRDRSQDLSEVISKSGVQPVWQMTHSKSQSLFRPLSAEKTGKSGIRPHCGLIDEVHEHPDNTVIEMLRAGTKGNRQALLFEITNSGFDRTSVCWQEHEYTAKVVRGEIPNDAWFGFICSLDKDDEPFEDESCWIKANPLLGVSIQPEFIREQVEEARGLPSKEQLVRRLHFCQWTDAESQWITSNVWAAVIDQKMTVENMDEERPAKQECYGGLDLSTRRDLSALILTFKTGEREYRTKEGPVLRPTMESYGWFWLPNHTLAEAEKRDRVPYTLWRDAKYLSVSDAEIIDYADIAAVISERHAAHPISAIAFDPHKISYLKKELDLIDCDVPLVEHSQGYRKMKDSQLWMHESIEQTEAAIYEGRLRVAWSPVLNWNVASAVVDSDASKNRKFEKRKATGRIDGAVALAMSIGAATAAVVEQKKVYQLLFA